MEKNYGTNCRHDGIEQTGRRRWTIYYGFGKDDENDDYGWDYRHVFEHRPTMDEIRSVILAQIDADTHDTILQGMVWNGQLVWLSDENQRNYTLWALSAERSGVMPTVKLGSDEEPFLHTFVDIDEVHSFISAVAAHIDNAINANRQAKAEIYWQVYELEKNEQL